MPTDTQYPFRGTHLQELLAGTCTKPVTATEAVIAVNMLRWRDALARLYSEYAQIRALTTIDPHRKNQWAQHIFDQIGAVARTDTMQPFPILLPSAEPAHLVETGTRVLVALIMAASPPPRLKPPANRVQEWLRRREFAEPTNLLPSADAAILTDFADRPAATREAVCDLIESWLAGAPSFAKPVPFGVVVGE